MASAPHREICFPVPARHKSWSVVLQVPRSAGRYFYLQGNCISKCHAMFSNHRQTFRFRGKSTNLLSEIGTGLKGAPDMGGQCGKGDFQKTRGCVFEGMEGEMASCASGFLKNLLKNFDTSAHGERLWLHFWTLRSLTPWDPGQLASQLADWRSDVRGNSSRVWEMTRPGVLALRRQDTAVETEPLALALLHGHLGNC